MYQNKDPQYGILSSTSAAATAESSKEPRREPLRHNPRLVFADPDDFFHDLLMEQQENH